jgi:hypothetical protein
LLNIKWYIFQLYHGENKLHRNFQVRKTGRYMYLLDFAMRCISHYYLPFPFVISFWTKLKTYMLKCHTKNIHHPKTNSLLLKIILHRRNMFYWLQWNLSKPNLFGTNFRIQNRQVFSLYRLKLTKISLTWDFIRSSVYAEFWFIQGLV